MMTKLISLWTAAALIGTTAGCERKVAAPIETTASEPLRALTGSVPAKATWSDLAVPPEPAVTPALLARGKQVYEQNCAACHGTNGDGQGLCSAFLIPRPRSFTQAHFRFRSTPSGHLPTDSDLFRTVSAGLAGTPMPPWRNRLSNADAWAVVEHVKTFSPRFTDPKEDRQTVVQSGAPPPRDPGTIATGKALYTKMGCFNCHGELGQGNGPSANSLTDDSGQHIQARDFTKPSGFKAGYATREIVRGFLTGFDGTPMPSYNELMSKEDSWKLAYYVETLVKTPVVPIARASQSFLEYEQLGAPDLRVTLTERAWKYDPPEIRVKRGQIVEITFEPTDNGLGAGHGFAISSYDEVAFINGAMVGVPKTVKFRADRAGRFTFYCATQCSTDKLHPLMNGTLIVEDAAPATASTH
ncbi:MAG: c-type cytochrome [Verrucomicrobia bacterium]|nr:c-type cytochrome [Verrucomicrobiota bacterium]